MTNRTVADRIADLERHLLALAVLEPQAAEQIFAEVELGSICTEALRRPWAEAQQLAADRALSPAMLAIRTESWTPQLLESIESLAGKLPPAPSMIEAHRVGRTSYLTAELLEGLTGSLPGLPMRGQEVGATLDAAASRLQELRGGMTFVAHDGDAATFLGEAVEAAKDRSLNLTLSTGIPDLDDMLLGGLRVGELTGVIGRSGHGKSCLAITAAVAAARAGHRTLYLSTEMLGPEVAKRLLAAQENLHVGEAMRRAMRGSIGLDRDRFTIIDDQTTLPPVASRVQEARVAGEPYQLVVLDFLQAMDGPGDSTHEKLERLAYAAKFLALRERCHVIAVLQMNRADEKARPNMRSIRASSGIENAIDNLVGLERGEDMGLDFLVDKARNAKTGELRHDDWGGPGPKYRLGEGTFLVTQEAMDVVPARQVLS